MKGSSPNPARPLVSIVTPVYNGARFIRETLLSVAAQSYPFLEHVIVDGGSTDETLSIIEAHRTTQTVVVSEKDNGLWDAVNKGMKLAKGDILSFLGSDDLLMPWGVNCIVEYFSRVGDCVWLTGIPTLFDTDGNMIWVAPVAPQYRRKWIRRRFYTGYGLGPMQMESIFWKRQLMDKVMPASGKLFDDRLKAAADIDLWCRFADHADIHQMGTVVAGWRKHDSNVSTVHWYREANAVRIPGGKAIGAMVSLSTLLWNEARGRRLRLKQLLASKQA